jgi:hypothetical protein
LLYGGYCDGGGARRDGLCELGVMAKLYVAKIIGGKVFCPLPSLFLFPLLFITTYYNNGGNAQSRTRIGAPQIRMEGIKTKEGMF